jgi:hypothetical protein
MTDERFRSGASGFGLTSCGPSGADLEVAGRRAEGVWSTPTNRGWPPCAAAPSPRGSASPPHCAATLLASACCLSSSQVFCFLLASCFHMLSPFGFSISCSVRGPHAELSSIEAVIIFRTSYHRRGEEEESLPGRVVRRVARQRYVDVDPWSRCAPVYY